MFCSFNYDNIKRIVSHEIITRIKTFFLVYALRKKCLSRVGNVINVNYI